MSVTCIITERKTMNIRWAKTLFVKEFILPVTGILLFWMVPAVAFIASCAVSGSTASTCTNSPSGYATFYQKGQNPVPALTYLHVRTVRFCYIPENGGIQLPKSLSYQSWNGSW